MNITQLKNKVNECGGQVRAYWSGDSEWGEENDNDTYYFGQRGYVESAGQYLNFIADCGPTQNEGMPVDRASEVHVPAIGHYSW